MQQAKIIGHDLVAKVKDNANKQLSKSAFIKVDLSLGTKS